MISSEDLDLVQRALRTHAMAARRQYAFDEEARAVRLFERLDRIRTTLYVSIEAVVMTFEEEQRRKLRIFNGEDPPPAA